MLCVYWNYCDTHRILIVNKKCPMQHVTGIGGLFFRSKNPAVLGQWYKQHFGIELVPGDYTRKPWSQEAGPTVFAPFPQDTSYFGRPEQQWMLNLRVRDLDRLVEELRAAKIDVSPDPEVYPNGRFARLHDPEGNPIELWEPK
jgi:glyoxylase I family protein